MKMTSNDFSVMGKLIDSVVRKYGYERWRGHRDAIDECTDKRIAWDLWHATGIEIGNGTDIPGKVLWYEYLTDDNIEEALLKYYQDKVKAELDAVIVETNEAE